MKPYESVKEFLANSVNFCVDILPVGRYAAVYRTYRKTVHLAFTSKDKFFQIRDMGTKGVIQLCISANLTHPITDQERGRLLGLITECFGATHANELYRKMLKKAAILVRRI
jgi:hypothetical protein